MCKVLLNTQISCPGHTCHSRTMFPRTFYPPFSTPNPKQMNPNCLSMVYSLVNLLSINNTSSHSVQSASDGGKSSGTAPQGGLGQQGSPYFLWAPAMAGLSSRVMGMVRSGTSLCLRGALTVSTPSSERDDVMVSGSTSSGIRYFLLNSLAMKPCSSCPKERRSGF